MALEQSLGSASTLPRIRIEPAPSTAGIHALGLTTGLVGLFSAGFFPADSRLLQLGLGCGALWLILVGLLEWRRCSLLGACAFTSYGMFWLSQEAMVLLPASGLGRPPQASSLAAYLAIWAMFSMFMFLGSLRNHRNLAALFGILAVMIVLVAIGKATGNPILEKLAGLIGLAGGVLASFTALDRQVSPAAKPPLQEP
ncbi:hypothetical protein DESUT3_21410 [Desulfuromonas versatilis]|uniref:GPR1/FUN34/yaaH family protein n=1 Tax=Desulfuromonas versatilis TaxID=2802975 RepID=A0ABM8HT47_9BACT|nr:acetate uptake transporter [Desulfuromonas versatilis]BCR05072.1 hypothetical protein DESUT3_21410 [Desulfuromonas versatilis]